MRLSFQAESMGRNPLYLMLPIAIATSFAYMLPVATPPNAIAFSYGRLKVTDMVSVILLSLYIIGFNNILIFTQINTHAVT